MGRNIKKGLEYFSVDTEWDRKMKLVKAKYGLEGIGFIIELWKTIYHEGYFIIWDDETSLLFFDSVGIDQNKGFGILDFGIGKALFRILNINGQKILTSRGIQKRYLEASLKRVEVHFCRSILLIEPTIPDWSRTKIIWDSEMDILDSETAILESEIPIKDTRNTQRKEVKKGSKGSKGSKETKSEGAPPSASPSEVNSRLEIPNQPSKSREEQLRKQAEALRLDDPKQYQRFIAQHPDIVAGDLQINGRPP